MNPQPVELDVAVGLHGERAAFHFEVIAPVDPYEFVAAVQACVRGLVSAAVDQERARSTPVVEIPRGKFDPEVARRRAAEAI